jgi:hypothetical protein
MRPSGAVLGSLLLVVACGATASAQYSQPSRYEMQYGEPVDVAIDDLIQMPEPYFGRAVRTTGTLDWVQGSGSGRSMDYGLKSFGGRVLIVPVREGAARFEDDARRWIGQDIEITGVLERGTDPQRNAPTAQLNFWGYYGPEEEKPEKREPAEVLTLEDLLRRPGQWDGRNVRVVGQFRGRNLFGDLPSASRRKSSDWVIKNDVFAVWVTGKKPEGKGWKLDAKLRRDTGKWIEVVGRVRTFRGVVYISAAGLALTKAPSPTARAEAPPPPPPPPLQPPVIVFSLPLDGERDIPPDTVFLVQFSNDMDDGSFEGRVGLRYAGRPRPGDRPLDAATTGYDVGRRALVVDPGDLLRAGRMVELILLPGIVDIDGQRLEPRPGHDPGGAAEVLRFQVTGTFLSGQSR